MTTVVKTITSTWTKIFDINLYGYYGLYLHEQAGDECRGSILFLENGNNSYNQTTILNIRGINLISYVVRDLPMIFQFEGCPERTFEIQKNNGFLEIRLTDGANISVQFTLFSGYPDKSLSLFPRINNTNKSSFQRLLTHNFPNMKNATAQVVAWMDDTLTSYTINIFDVNNKTTLLETTLTNTSEGVQDLGVLTNLSSTSVQVDISIKKNGGNSSSKVYLESLTLNYN